MRLRTGALLCTAALAACGGGVGSASVPLAPTSAPRASASVQFAITVPAATGTPYRTIRPALHAKRRPLYVSPATTTLQVLLVPSGGGSPTPLGAATIAAPGTSGTTQTVSVAAPVGSDTFEIQLLDTAGHVLADGTATATIGYGQPNAVAVTALGVPAYATMSPSTVTPPLDHASHVIPLGVTVYDAAGYAISGTFATALTLGMTGPSSDYTLSTTTLASATDAANATLTFDGAQSAPARVFVLGVQKAFAAATPFRGGALPAGGALLAVDTAGNVSRVDARTYAVSAVGSATSGAPPFTAATTLGASPDGSAALIGRGDGQIAYYDGAQKAITGTLATGEPSVLAIAFTDAPGQAWALTTAASGYAVVPITMGTGGIGGALVGAATALPAAAQHCGALETTSYGGGVVVACSDATYLLWPASPWSSTAPGTASLAQQKLGSTLFGAGYNGTTYSGLVGFNVGATSLSQAATYPSAFGSPITLDTTSQIAYAAVFNGVAAYDVSPGGTGATLATAAFGAQPVALADYPGTYGGTQPILGDATVWAAEATGKIDVISTSSFTVTKTITVGSSLTGIGFVP